MTRILILCTGNSCRSQMAEGLLRSIDPKLHIASAGTHPAPRVHPDAVAVMAEAGIDIRDHTPKSVDQFIGEPLDFVITVCDDAKESCPAFTGNVRHRIHLPFRDPSGVTGTPEEVLIEFRRARDEIARAFRALYQERLRSP